MIVRVMGELKTAVVQYVPAVLSYSSFIVYSDRSKFNAPMIGKEISVGVYIGSNKVMNHLRNLWIDC